MKTKITTTATFGGQPIAEKNQAGDWSDYIFAGGKRVAKSDSFENRIHISGTASCSSCNSDTWVQLPSSPLIGTYQVKSGDTLMFRQLTLGGAHGGIGIWFQNGTSTHWVSKDQNQNYANSDTVATSWWNNRKVLLNDFVGQTISRIAFGTDRDTPSGTWNLYFNDVVIVSSDGTVNPIYTGQPSAGLSLYSAYNVTNVTSEVNHDSYAGTNTATSIAYYHGDHLGSARMMTSAGGWPVSQSTYLPFGWEYNAPTGPWVNHYKFTGKERDAESGLDYFGARYDSSSMGRFMTPDPLLNSGQPWNPQSWNRYAYVENNPLRYTDPTGLYKWGSCSGDAKSCEAQQQRFRDSLDNLKKAAGQLKEGSKERKELEKTIKKIGEEGKGNIKVNFGDAGSTNGVPNAGLTVGNSITINYAAVDSVKSDYNLNSSESAALDAGVTAHEGTHAGGGPSILGFIGMRGEHAAYWNESATYQGLHNTDKPFQLWNESWGKLDEKVLNQTREQAIQHWLHPDKVPAPNPNAGGPQ